MGAQHVLARRYMELAAALRNAATAAGLRWSR